MSIMFPSSDINDTSNIYFRYFFHQHFLLRFLGEKRPLTKLELEYWTVLFLHACPGWTYVQMSCHSSYKFYYFLLFFFLISMHSLIYLLILCLLFWVAFATAYWAMLSFCIRIILWKRNRWSSSHWSVFELFLMLTMVLN